MCGGKKKKKTTPKNPYVCNFLQEPQHLYRRDNRARQELLSNDIRQREILWPIGCVCATFIYLIYFFLLTWYFILCNGPWAIKLIYVFLCQALALMLL